MADEQPNTSSTDVQTSDASASEPSSDRSEAQSSESPSWWQRMFRRRGDGEEAPAPDADKAKPDAPASTTLSLTQEELERRIQSETDRRERKREADTAARAKRELRDKDPWAYVEQQRKDEQLAETSDQWTQFFTNVGVEHDRASIDPVAERLPKEELERIMKLEGAGIGLAGRKLVVTEGLKALEKHWKAEGAKDAESKLRRNPAFRKQLLNEIRGQTPEPELLPGASGSDADETISGLLRTHYRMG